MPESKRAACTSRPPANAAHLESDSQLESSEGKRNQGLESTQDRKTEKRHSHTELGYQWTITLSREGPKDTQSTPPHNGRDNLLNGVKERESL